MGRHAAGAEAVLSPVNLPARRRPRTVIVGQLMAPHVHTTVKMLVTIRPASRGSGLDAAQRAVDNGQLSDDAAVHARPRRRRSRSTVLRALHTLCAAPERDSTPRLQSQPQSHCVPRHRRIGTPARWTDRALQQEPRDHKMRRE